MSLNVKIAFESLYSKRISSSPRRFDFNKFNGFFGRIGFEFALFDENQIEKKESSLNIPDVHLFLFKYVIVIDHFKDNGTIVSNSLTPDSNDELEIETLLYKRPFTDLPFEKTGEEKVDFSCYLYFFLDLMY